MSHATQTARTETVLLESPDPFDVLEQLPNAVFPVRAKIQLHRSREHDTTHETFERPSYPVAVQVPTTAYIPETTIYFDNPAERPRGDTKAWTVDEALDGLSDAVDAIVAEYPVEREALALLSVDIVEVPTHFVTTNADSGTPHVKPSLYDRQGEMRIAHFQRDGALSATAVREELSETLPGQSRSPIQLTAVEHVTAKPFRQGQQSQGSAGIARYYTERDAENVDDLSLTPAIYRLQHLARDGDRSRPLRPSLSNLEDLLPVMSRQADDLLRPVTFAGEELERSVFHAEEVLR